MALSAKRNTKQKAYTQTAALAWPVKGTTKIHQGSLVALNGGYAAPGATATGRIAVGRANASVDNTSGGDGDLTIEVEEGIFKWANSSGDAVTAAELGATVYIEDDQTVCKTSSSKSAAGKAVALDDDGDSVWVKTVL